MILVVASFESGCDLKRRTEEKNTCLGSPDLKNLSQIVMGVNIVLKFNYSKPNTPVSLLYRFLLWKLTTSRCLYLLLSLAHKNNLRSQLLIAHWWRTSYVIPIDVIRWENYQYNIHIIIIDISGANKLWLKCIREKKYGFFLKINKKIKQN